MLYPNFYELEAYKHCPFKFYQPLRKTVKSVISGNHHSSERGRGIELDTVREYVLGDDIRSIDWRVTARAGTPHIKIFKEERQKQVMICVDMNSSMRFGTRNTFKSVQASRIASLIGWSAISNQDAVHACTFGDVVNGIQFFKSKNNQKSFSSFLKSLCEPVEQHHQILPELAVQQTTRLMGRGSILYLISDFLALTPALKEQLAVCRLRRQADVVFIAINDISDAKITPIGTIQFHSKNGDKTWVNTNDPASRQAWHEIWIKNRLELASLTNDFGIPLIELSTESDVMYELNASLKKMTRGKSL